MFSRTKENKCDETDLSKPFGGEIIRLYQRPVQTLEERFNDLVNKWKEETVAISSPLRKCLNENYLKILKLKGNPVPLILKELEKEPDDWFLLLRILTEENPVRPEEVGSFRLVTEAWLRWGKEKKLI